jgi:hypothetical protein
MANFQLGAVLACAAGRRTALLTHIDVVAYNDDALITVPLSTGLG